MRVLIQDLDSDKYVGDDGELTSDPEAAKDFGVTDFAYECGVHLACAPFRVVLHLPGTGELIEFMEGRGYARKPADFALDL